jgi:hypothetical protein
MAISGMTPRSSYPAVSADEPPGKSLDHLRQVSVTITISEPGDADILKSQGISGLRKHNLLRFANEAYDQGGLVVQEDPALLLTTSTRTIQRDMREELFSSGNQYNT